MFASPDGGKIAVFSSQAKALSGHSLDGGKTWEPVGRAIENGDPTYMTAPRFGKDASRNVFYIYFFKDYGGACWRFEWKQ